VLRGDVLKGLVGKGDIGCCPVAIILGRVALVILELLELSLDSLAHFVKLPLLRFRRELVQELVPRGAIVWAERVLDLCRALRWRCCRGRWRQAGLSH